MNLVAKHFSFGSAVLLCAALMWTGSGLCGDGRVELLERYVYDDIRETGLAETIQEGLPSPLVSFTLTNAVFSVVEEDRQLIESKRGLADNERALLSDNGTYVVIQTHGPGAKVVHVAVQDRLGSILWEKETPGYTSVAGISNDGSLLIATSVDGSPIGITKNVTYTFYDGAGRIRGEVEVENPVISKLSPDGTRFTVCTHQGDIFVYDQNAQLKWSVKEPCKRLAISNNATTVASYEFKSMSLYETGKLVTRISTDNPLRNIAVSDLGNIVLVSTSHELYCYDMPSGKILWEFALPSNQLYFNSISVSGNGDYIACGVQRDKGESFDVDSRYLEGIAYLFDRDGNSLWQSEYDYSKSNAWTPVVNLSENANFFTVKTRDGLDLYGIDDSEK